MLTRRAIALSCALLLLAAAPAPPTLDPFKGVTLPGARPVNLFPIKATGVSTAPVRHAAEAYLGVFPADQRAKLSLPVTDAAAWRSWDNRSTPAAARHGVSFRDMTEQQRAFAFNLFEASLSAKGLRRVHDTMHLNETLAELMHNVEQFGQWNYNLTIFGTPSDTAPWGWQLDGHHLVINYLVLGDQVVMTPTFMGCEPATAASGQFKGTSVLQDEQAEGLALMRALAPAQQDTARVAKKKSPTNTLAEAYHDNVNLDAAGIRAAELTPEQQKLLLALIGEYVGNMDDAHARLRMADIESHLADTRFAWIGDTADDAVFYYRVQSPVILIEFDHQRPAFLGNGSNAPSRQHIHTVVRTPNGNDYGLDLLRQHYASETAPKP